MLKVTYEDRTVVPGMEIKSIPANTTFTGNIGGISGVFLKNEFTIVCLNSANFWTDANRNLGHVKHYEEVDVEIVVRRKK
jgi:hypothetical protein